LPHPVRMATAEGRTVVGDLVVVVWTWPSKIFEVCASTERVRGDVVDLEVAASTTSRDYAGRVALVERPADRGRHGASRRADIDDRVAITGDVFEGRITR
jgi:hypothetical protein